MKLEILRIPINSVGLRGINMRRKNENHVINYKKKKKNKTNKQVINGPKTNMLQGKIK